MKIEITVCDKCGVEFLHARLAKKHQVTLPKTTKKIKMDLCEDCYSEVKKFEKDVTKFYNSFKRFKVSRKKPPAPKKKTAPKSKK